MNLYKLMRPTDFIDPTFKNKPISLLKSYRRKVIYDTKGIYKITPDLQELRNQSFILYIIAGIWHCVRCLYYVIFSASTDVNWSIYHHFLIKDINKKTEWNDWRGHIVICKKCGFPFPRSSVDCDYCDSIDEEEWEKYHLEILQGLEVVDTEDKFEKAADAILELGNIIKLIPTVGKEASKFCPGCGADKSGVFCKYCGTQLVNE